MLTIFICFVLFLLQEDPILASYAFIDGVYCNGKRKEAAMQLDQLIFLVLIRRDGHIEFLGNWR
jgi:hypothetical protein